jgi:tetratricopeptide (TPR) repeat protein/tRNA A-37 threonylcarbamoyl transferase component Bud32
MSHSTATGHQGEALARLRRIDQVCDRFEAAWPAPGSGAPRPRLEDFLADVPEPERPDVLSELLALELAYGRDAGGEPDLEAYLLRFPQHQALVRRVFHERLEPASPDATPLKRDGDETVREVPSPGAAAAGTDVSAGEMSPAGRFRPLRYHARGGLGVVHVAEDGELRRQVALKRIREQFADDPASRQRFLREAEITGGLEHPGIVPVYGLGQGANGRPFYAMRFIKGDSLKEAIERFHRAETPARDPGERTLALRELLGRFVNVCNTVAYAHSRGVLHRDLKPANVMLGPYGETLVVDWGLAKWVGRPEGAPDLTEDTLRPGGAGGSAPTEYGRVLGTPQFMSPEQAAGWLAELGPASDVYSLGATLYCLLTGEAPFGEGDVEQVLMSVRRGEIPPPRQVKRDVPPALAAVCLKAMALRPGDRYQTALELAGEVQHWLADEPVRAWPEPWGVRLGRWGRRHKPLVSGAVAAALVAVLGASAGVVWYQAEQNRRATDAALREAEEGRRLALAEQGVGEALKQAEAARRQLRQTLGRPGGVFGLLNEPARWQGSIQAAQGSLDRAAALLANARPGAHADLERRLRDLEADVRRDDADRVLALRLEKIRLDTAVIVERKFDEAQARREYPRAFHDAGMAIAPGHQKTVAALVRQSAIQEQLLAALDDWALAAHRRRPPDLCGRLLEVARLADPDPWRDQVRDPSLWQRRQALARLADTAQADHQLMARLSPQILRVVGSLLPQGRREKWMRLAQALHPADFWLNFELAQVLRQTKQPLEAAGFYRVALALRPNTAGVYNNLGVVLADEKDLPGAIDAYQKALAIDSKHAMAWNNLGAALYRRKDLPGAIDAFQKAVAIDSKYALAWCNLGNAFLAQGQLDPAIQQYRKAIELDANFGWPHSGLGIALRRKQQLDAAIREYRKAIELDAKDALPHYNLGLALAAKHQLGGAIDEYRRAIALDPNDAVAHYHLAHALRDAQQLDAAVCEYRRAIELDPKDAKAHIMLGVTLHDQDQLDGAIREYRCAIALDASSALAHYNLGNALRHKQEFDAAILEYRRAIALDAKYAEAHCNLGYALQLKGLLAESLAEFREGHRLGSGKRNWPHPSAQWVRKAEGFVEIDRKLSAILAGRVEPANDAERLALTEFCRQPFKKLYVASSRFYTEAFAHDPRLADDMQVRHRYHAACAAALAGCGQGKDADPLDTLERARLRRQAVAWLRADLAHWTRQARSLKPADRQLVQQTLRHWQDDADLAGIRREQALKELPGDERQACRKLWANVAELLEKVQQKLK